MTNEDKFLCFITALIIFCLFIYGFDFTNNIYEQIALIISGLLFGNLITVADYAKEK